MNEHNYTERTRKVLSLAREEAARFGSPYVDADHVMLGLLQERDGLGAVALELLSGDLAQFAESIRRIMPVHGSSHDDAMLLTFSSSAKHVLVQSMAIAEEMDHAYVGTEHVLLGILRDGRARSAMILASRGVTYDRGREAVMHFLTTSGDAPLGVRHALSAEIEVQMNDGTTARRRCATLNEAIRFLVVHQLR